jgi:hypothetical protein
MGEIWNAWVCVLWSLSRNAVKHVLNLGVELRELEEVDSVRH